MLVSLLVAFVCSQKNLSAADKATLADIFRKTLAGGRTLQRDVKFSLETRLALDFKYSRLLEDWWWARLRL